MSDRPGKILNFGAKVVGAVRAAAAVAQIVEKRTRFGPKVLGDKVVKGTNTPAPDSQPVPKKSAILSVTALRELLEKNPAHMKHLIAQESRRPAGVRPEAVDVFLDIASKLEGQAQDEALELIAGLKPPPVKRAPATESTTAGTDSEQGTSGETRKESKANATKAEKPKKKKAANAE